MLEIKSANQFSFKSALSMLNCYLVPLSTFVSEKRSTTGRKNEKSVYSLYAGLPLKMASTKHISLNMTPHKLKAELMDKDMEYLSFNKRKTSNTSPFVRDKPSKINLNSFERIMMTTEGSSPHQSRRGNQIPDLQLIQSLFKRHVTNFT